VQMLGAYSNHGPFHHGCRIIYAHLYRIVPFPRLGGMHHRYELAA
jgi:hypothetical protein